MKKTFLLAILLLGYLQHSVAQVAVNTDGSLPAESSMLDVKSIDKGILIPRLTILQRDAIISPPNGLMIFVTDNNRFNYFDTISNSWQELLNTSINYVSIVNIDTSTFVTTEKQTDSDTIEVVINDTLRWRFNGNILEPLNNGQSVLIGWKTGEVNGNTADSNVFVGTYVGPFNTTGSNNTSIGLASFTYNTTGNDNVGLGMSSLYTNNGNRNIALGNGALEQNISGSDNIGVVDAMLGNITGNRNIAIGRFALENNINSNNNIAIGTSTLRNIYFDTATTPYGLNTYNIAIGEGALSSPNKRSYSYDNIAIGYKSNNICRSPNGHGSVSIGSLSLWHNGHGGYIEAVGFETLNTVRDARHVSGFGASTDIDTSRIYHNSAAVGYGVTITASNVIRLGNSNVTKIGGQVEWTTLSDGRFKTDIKEDVKGVELITALRPVSYNLDREKFSQFINRNLKQNKQSASDSKRQSGFIAQEVETAAIKLGIEFNGVDAPKNQTDYYSLRYAQFVVPLVKGVQEQQKKIEQQAKTMETQQKLIDQLTLEINKIEKSLDN
jgi:hypothetical protein